MKSVMFFVGMLLMIMLCVSMVGCHTVPRQTIVVMPQFAGKPVVESHAARIKYELKESVDIKEDPSKPNPVITAGIGFSQSW